MNQPKEDRFSLVFVGHPFLQSLFDDLMKLYYCQLTELGYAVDIQNNRLHGDRINLIFGNRFLAPKELVYISQHFDYIIMQFEQLSTSEGWFQRELAVLPEFLSFFKAALAVWDYSPHNLSFLAKYGVSAVCLMPGYDPALQDIPASPTKDIDVLFYGSHSQRRLHVLQELTKVCQLVQRKNCNKAERNALISRSKIVLNLHCFETLTLLEQARTFYLLSNQVLVISETSLDNPYADALLSYDYADLVAGLLSWLNKSEQARQFQAYLGFEAIQRIPFQLQLQQAIVALPMRSS